MNSKVQSVVCAGFTLAALAAPLSAPQGASGAVAVVTALRGEGAARGEAGEPIQLFDSGGRFQPSAASLKLDERIVTGPEGGATLSLTDRATIVHLGPDTTCSFFAQRDLADDAGGFVHVQQGRAEVLRRRSDNRWMVTAAGNGPSGGYMLSQGASFVVQVEGDVVSISVIQGEGWAFRGAVPAGALLDESGTPRDRSGVRIAAGQRVVLGAAEAEADAQADAARSGDRRRQDVYAFALTCGGNWLHRAEQGDFTPVRGESRGPSDLVRGEVSTELAFDQPRTPVLALVPRVVTQPLRSALVNPARALIESGIPTSVVVGQRLRRTRIIGNPGTTGPIRVNPNVEPLIRLPR